MIGIGQSLRDLSDAASFTVTDMATWCEVHKSAMREWMTKDVEPHPIKKKLVAQRLELLACYLKKGELLPVPITVKQYERKAYIERARADALNKVPRGNSAGGRRKVLDEHQGQKGS